MITSAISETVARISIVRNEIDALKDDENYRYSTCYGVKHRRTQYHRVSFLRESRTRQTCTNDLFAGEARSRCGWISERALNLDVAFSLAARAISWIFRYTYIPAYTRYIGIVHIHIYMTPRGLRNKCNNGKS